MNKERKRESDKRSYLKHRAQRLAYFHEYRRIHRDDLLIKQRQRYWQNHDRILAMQRANYQAIKMNPARIERRRELAREYRRQWRVANRDKYLAQRRIKRMRLKLKVLEKLGGTICANCGCTELSFLEVNHKDGGGTKELKLLAQRRKFYEEILAERRDTRDLNILCRVCNALDYLKRKNPHEAANYKIEWNLNRVLAYAIGMPEIVGDVCSLAPIKTVGVPYLEPQERDGWRELVGSRLERGKEVA